MRQAGMKTYLRASCPARESLGMISSLEKLLSGEGRPCREDVGVVMRCKAAASEVAYRFWLIYVCDWLSAGVWA